MEHVGLSASSKFKNHCFTLTDAALLNTWMSMKVNYATLQGRIQTVANDLHKSLNFLIDKDKEGFIWLHFGRVQFKSLKPRLHCAGAQVVPDSLNAAEVTLHHCCDWVHVFFIRKKFIRK